MAAFVMPVRFEIVVRILPVLLMAGLSFGGAKVGKMNMRVFSTLTFTLIACIACDGSKTRFVSMSAVQWEQLNPKRGDKSPKSGTLWGNRTGPGPSGFLLRPVDGFSSPPHVHTADYHGVVIAGTIHNEHPDAKVQYMPAGSFWTQPGGGIHITACRGRCLAYIEVEDAFDVQPVAKARQDIAAAMNLSPGKIAWSDPPGMPASASGPKVAFVRGKTGAKQTSGTLVKLPAEFAGLILRHGGAFHAVVIMGKMEYRRPGRGHPRTLGPGDYFSSKEPSRYQVSCRPRADCMLYVRAEGTFDFAPASD